MRRIHLFELEDLSWVPPAVRDGGTDLLDFGFAKARFYDGVAPKLLGVLDATREDRVVDVCSGGGGGTLMLRALVRATGRNVGVLLTDRHPNEAAAARVRALGDPETTYLLTPVDATRVPSELRGVRTMAGALHHFTPDVVREILTALVAQGLPLAFFDVAASKGLRRAPIVVAPLAFVVNFFALFAVSVLLVPFIRPFRLSRWLLTYALPLIPILVAWDGTASAMRAYSPDELLDIAQTVPGSDAYTWDAGVSGAALYLTGIPRSHSETR